MTDIILSTLPAHYETPVPDQPPVVVVELTGPHYGRETVEANTLKRVRAEIAGFGGRVATNHPGVSFMVTAACRYGQRKPMGFDRALVEGDRLGTRAWMQHCDGARAAA